MYIALIVCLVSAAWAAPTAELRSRSVDSQRQARSYYGGESSGGYLAGNSGNYLGGNSASFVASSGGYGGCGVSAAAAIPVGGSYLGPQHASLHYREDNENNREMNSRSYYEGGAGLSALQGLSGLSVASAGSAASAQAGAAAVGNAYGVFPSSQSGPCAAPLLLTCSPSITHGHIVHSSHSAPAASYAAPAIALAPGPSPAAAAYGASYKEAEHVEKELVKDMKSEKTIISDVHH